jgi:hypothetical protein
MGAGGRVCAYRVLGFDRRREEGTGIGSEGSAFRGRGGGGRREERGGKVAARRKRSARDRSSFV